MQPKKNEKADLTRSSGLFFAIGFALVSALTYAGFEMKTYDKKVVDDRKSDIDNDLIEDVEDFVMEEIPLPQPPPMTPPEELEVVKNEEKIEEAIFESTEVDKEEKIVQVQQIQAVEEPEEDIEVPFAVIEDKPMFENCKHLAKNPKALQDCFKSTLDKHVIKNFNYPPAAAEMQIQGRVYVYFRIDKEGKVSVVSVRGPDKMLEAEARRIIEKLPRLEPGKQRGKPTAVTYSYPIVFKLQN